MKWQWPDELQPPIRYNLLCVLSDGTMRICRRFGLEKEAYILFEINSRNMPIRENSWPDTDLICWTIAKYPPYKFAKEPQTKWGKMRKEKSDANKARYADLKKQLVEEGEKSQGF